MKSAIWISLFLVGVAGVATPLLYFQVARGLPQLDTEFDLEKLLRLEIEGERLSVKRGQYQREPGEISFARPEFAKLPKDLVALYLSARGCPAYFQVRREDSVRWGWRLFRSAWGAVPSDQGQCEAMLADLLAHRIGARAGLERAVAAHKLHRFLTKDQLLAYDLASVRFARAVIGVEEAAKVLFKKPIDQLQLSELAELALTLPPHGYFEQLRICQNPILIRQNRDHLLRQLAKDALISEEQAKQAQAQPVACQG